MDVFEANRIVTPYASLGCNMTIAESGIYHNTKVYSLIPKPERQESIYYWLGILNSKILWWFLSNTGYVLRGGYFTFTTKYLNPFPIPILNHSNNKVVQLYNQISDLSEQQIIFHQKIHTVKTAQERTMLKRQIAAVDRQIDQLVYELYELTPEEIAIVEAATKDP
jgi:hypothetical protein